MSEGQIAGRLEVLVEASLAGFKQKLKEKVEAASKGVEAKVGVKVEEKALRKRLQAAVDKASDGVTANIEIVIESAGLRKRLQYQVDKAASGVTATIGVDLDAKSLAAKVKAAAEAASTDVKVGVDEKNSARSAKKAAKAAALAAEKDAVRTGGIKVPITTRGKLWLAAKAEQVKAQSWLRGNPLTVLFRTKEVGPKSADKNIGKGLLKKLLKPAMIVGLVSLIQPAVGALGQLVGGLGAVVGAAAPAVGAIAALPIGISTVITSMAGLKVATQGIGQAFKAANQQQDALASGHKLTAAQQQKLEASMKGLSPSAKRFITNTLDLKDAWKKARTEIQEPLFKRLAADIKPVAKDLLPVITKGMVGTSKAAGSVVDRFAQLAHTSRFQKDLGGVFRQNNQTLEAGGKAVTYLASGWLSFQRAAAPFQRDLNRNALSLSKRFANSMEENRKNGDTGAFLDKAETRLKKLWSITKQVGSGIGGIFAAGDKSGMRLLDSMDKWSAKWAKWTHSDGGAKQIGKWFDDVEPGFREFIGIIKDSGKALLDWSDDPSTTTFLKKIHNEFGPALNGLLTSLGQNTSGNVVDMLTLLAQTADDLAPVANVFADVAGGVIALGKGLHSLASQGGAVGVLGKIGEAAVVLKLISGKGFGLGRLLPKSGGKAAGGGLLSGLLGRATGAVKGVQKVFVVNMGAGGLGGAAGGAAGAAGGAAAGAEEGAAVGAAASAGRFAKFAKFAKPAAIAKPASVGVLVAALGLGVHEQIQGFLAGRGSAKEKDPNLSQFNKPRSTAKNLLYGIPTHSVSHDINAVKNSQKLGGIGAKVDQAAAGLVGGDGLTKSIANVKKLDASLSKLTLKNKAAGQAEYNKALEKSGLDARDLAKVLPKTAAAMATVNDKSKTGARSFGLASSVINKLAPQMGKYGNVLRTLPKDLRTSVSAPGALKTMADVRNVAKVYKLTPKQVRTIMALQGFSAVQQRIMILGKAYSGLPRGVKTAINTPGAIKSQADVAALQKRYHLTPKQVATVFKASGVQSVAAAAAAAKAALGRIPKTVWVDIKGRNHVNHGPVASGNAASARGNIFASIKAFAKGGFGDVPDRHRPELAGPGNVRVWREKETKGEAYIPLANDDRRPRAKEILKKVVGMFGGVAQFATGGITKAVNGLSSFAAGGVTGGASAGNGLVAGLVAARPAVKAAVAANLRLITSERQYAAAGKKVAKHVKKHLSRAARMRNLRKERASAQNREDRLIGERGDVMSGLAASGADYGSVSSISAANGGYIAPANLIAELRDRVQKTKAYQAALRVLRKHGMGNTLYRQLLDAGVEAGGPMVEQLKGATGGELKQINSLQGQISGTAKQIGAQASKAMYDAGISAAKGLIRGITSQLKHLAKAGHAAGKSVHKGTKKALKSKSPSRVMFDEGVNAADGLDLGIASRAKRLFKTARAVSSELTQHLTPSAGAPTLYAASRAASATGLTAAPAPTALAPLIGHLTIQGKSPEEIADAYEQTMFTLRRMRQGGIHADRTA
jgi:hypothetical protein